MSSFADRVIDFNNKLEFKGNLPDGISIMNPFKENPQINVITGRFYNKFYNNNKKRQLILGINPGRFGAGVTGVPFTDTKRMKEFCGIDIEGIKTHEPSSVFVYETISAFGGVKKFYNKFFIGAVCPLGFVKGQSNGKYINYNYYDSKELTSAVYSFIVKNIKKLVQLGIYTDNCYCLGTGKNYDFLAKLNNEYRFFEKIIALEHPRFIMQYRAKKKNEFIQKYLKILNDRA
jgi:hypothetical protein